MIVLELSLSLWHKNYIDKYKENLMSFNLKTNESQQPTNDFFDVKGFWKFENEFLDSSGKKNNLNPVNSPPLRKNQKLSGSVSLDGIEQCLGTDNPVVDTEGSYTIAAWVRLESSKMNGKLSLPVGEHALTAVSQDTSTHSNFYLGLRQIDQEQPDGSLASSLRWNFTVSPIDGSETGAVEWQHAHSGRPLDDEDLDKWFLLVGVCDVKNRTANIYVPNSNEKGVINWPENLVQLPSEGGLQVGRGRWLGRDVDFWPGTIGPVKVLSGALSEEQAKEIYTKGEL